MVAVASWTRHAAPPGAEFSSGYVSWRKAKDSIGLDVAQLLGDKPYLQAKYPLLKPGARRFLVG